MNDIASIKRKIFLKRQALKLFKDEIEALQEQMVLAFLMDRYEKKAINNDDLTLSRKLDCINYLLEN